MRESQVTAARLVALFKVRSTFARLLQYNTHHRQVIEITLHLTDTFSGKVEFPDVAGSFDLSEVRNGTRLHVEGEDDAKPNHLSTSSFSRLPGIHSFTSSSDFDDRRRDFMSASSSASLASGRGSFQRESTGATRRPTFLFEGKQPSRKGKEKQRTKSLVVRGARVKGGKVSPLQTQCHVSVNEDTANVRYVTEQVRLAFAKDNLVILSNNGLEILDMPGTRGKPLIIITFFRRHIF